MSARIAAGFVGLWVASLCGTAVGADIYRWVDEKGRTHLSDTVPEKFRAGARKFDSRSFEVGDAQRRQAMAQAAALREAAARPAPLPPSAASGAAGATPTAAGDAARPSRPASGVASAGTATAGDCAARQKQYLDALACMAPCVNANGTLRGGCSCPILMDPSRACGLPNLAQPAPLSIGPGRP